MISLLKIYVDQSQCTGIYLRWWFNGWHYWNFSNNYEVKMKSSAEDIQTVQVFSVISKIERPTKIKTEYSCIVTAEGIKASQVDAFASLLMSEKVEQYTGGEWYEVDITRDEQPLRDGDSPSYKMQFEVTRKELPETAAVFQKSQYLYIGDTLADLDDDEIIAQNKQVNDIAEMKDRQTDYTASFKIRKTRAMRELFELSGEVGANTDFPYQLQTCRLIQDGIEMISNGLLKLLSSDNQYYKVSIYSGNKNFFTEIESSKLSDLSLTDCQHTWDASTMAASHALSDAPYIYPLCEPSDDGGIIPATDDGDACVINENQLWPFIRVKEIWDEIFSNANYTASGDILTDPYFLGLYMPIVQLTAGNTDEYLYSLYNNTPNYYAFGVDQLEPTGNVVINGTGDADWLAGTYVFRYTATYKVRVYLEILSTSIDIEATLPRIRFGGEELTLLEYEQYTEYKKKLYYEGEYDGTAGNDTIFQINSLKVLGTYVYYYDTAIIEINDAALGIGSTVEPNLNMPDMTQGTFIKALCNIFGLIPEAKPRDRTIIFWNFSILYENIPIARDWSNYLSEKDDSSEFRFGDYAQRNLMKYKENDDVIPGNGDGLLEVDDSALSLEKDLFSVPFSYCDEVQVLTDVRTVRINMNKYDAQDDAYEASDKIAARLVYVSEVTEDLAASPPYQKTLTFKEVDSPYTEHDVITPHNAQSLPLAFSHLVTYYGGLSKMLDKANLRKAKFNLPAYEVEGLKHYVPIYLRQYKAYFYVSKINNYVNGKLCTCDLIKLL